MPQETRQSEILNLLLVHRSCQISDLALRFDVSEETIRRDIKQLEGEGHAYRVRGGVKLAEKILEAPYLIRRNQNGVQKRDIALLAATLVQDGMTILVDSGSTAYWLAKALANHRNLSVITNAMEVARELAATDCRVFFAGGQVDYNYQSCFGPETEAFMRGFTPEIAFFSVSAIDSKRGMSDIHYPEALLKRALAPLASRVVVLADSSKFERAGFVKALDFNQVDALVTDAMPGAALQEALAGVDILVTSSSQNGAPDA